MPDERPLAGLTLLLTRPGQQGHSTAGVLRAAGAIVIEMPVLEILPLSCTVDSRTLAAAYIVIFVSANAVEHGVPCLLASGGIAGGTLVAAIGQATTHALNAAGYADVVSPQQSIDSEGLLAMPQLQQALVRGQHVILVRGISESGGRKLLEESLVARGAIVETAICYERRARLPPREQIESLIKMKKTNFAAMVLSVETLDSLLDALAEQAALLKSAWLLVPHARVACAAGARGFLHVAEIGMAADSMIAELIQLKVRICAPSA